MHVFLFFSSVLTKRQHSMMVCNLSFWWGVAVEQGRSFMERTSDFLEKRRSLIELQCLVWCD